MSQVFVDLDDIVDRHLITTKIGKPPYFKIKTNALAYTAKLSGFDAMAMLDAMLSHLESEWNKNGQKPKSKSVENWRWEPKTPYKTTSLEVSLERSIVRELNNHHGTDDWTNQVPAASGLFDSTDSRRAIDLVHRIERDVTYELIELKYGSNNPLHAAMELMQYAILYIFARKHPAPCQPQTEILRANKILLSVLAPPEYYRGYQLKWFEQELDTAASSFAAKHVQGLEMHFQFKQFPIMVWPSCQLAIQTIKPVY